MYAKWVCNKWVNRRKTNPDSSSFIYIYFPFHNFSKGTEKIFLYSKLMQQGALNTSVFFLYVKGAHKISIPVQRTEHFFSFYSEVCVLSQQFSNFTWKSQKSKQANTQEAGSPKSMLRAPSNLESALCSLCPPPYWGTQHEPGCSDTLHKYSSILLW